LQIAAPEFTIRRYGADGVVMGLTRRSLLAGLACVAAAVAVRGASAPFLSDREAFFRTEYEWAARALLDAIDSGDYSPWQGGSAEEAPSRWRLARAIVMIREAEELSELEQALRRALEQVWSSLTRPEWLERHDVNYRAEPPRRQSVKVWQVWEGLPQNERAHMIRETVGARFGGDARAERIAVYITAQLVAINTAALGRLFDRDVQWTLRALHGIEGESKDDVAFASDLASVQEAIADRLQPLAQGGSA
jgi:hypothetical protein